MTESVKRVDYSRQFQKSLKKAPLATKIAFRKRRELFQKDPFHALLNNHSLSGKLKGYRSINITGDWRAIYSEYKDEANNTIIVFEILGTHSQLYG